MLKCDLFAQVLLLHDSGTYLFPDLLLQFMLMLPQYSKVKFCHMRL